MPESPVTLTQKQKVPLITADKLTLVPAVPLEATLLNRRRVKLTMEKAEWYINLPVFPGEREVEDAHVQKLYDAMKQRTFNWDPITLAHCLFEGKNWKINAQHTCWARAFLDGDIDSPDVTELSYSAETEDQMRQLYSTFDAGKDRSANHRTVVLLVNTAPATGLANRIVGRMSTALKFWLYPKKEEFNRLGPQELSNLIKDKYVALFQQVGKFWQGNQDAPDIGRMPVLAAMFDNFAKVPTLAPSFWKPVCDGIGLDSKDDPRWRLRKYLGETTLHRTSENTDKNATDPETMYKTCISAWNKWRLGETVQVLRPTQKRVKSA